VAPFPLVNAPDGILDEAVRAALEKHGVFRGGPRRVEVYFTAAIRRYVELGFGLGLLLGLPTSPVPPGLRQRSLSQHLGRVPVSLVWRKGDALRERGYARAFAHAVRTGLQRPVSRGR
jgi:DNA-binding transcriptional LysR family regulator